MIVSLYRPSPQVSKPTATAALTCFDSACFIINLSSQQVKKSAVDVTWVFLLTVYMSLNTLLWTLSYPEVRSKHPREELEDMVNIAVEIITQCSERWPGSESAAQLYAVFAKACMQSYDIKEESPAGGPNPFDTPPSLVDASSPDSEMSLPSGLATYPQQQGPGIFNTTSMFGYVFNASPEEHFGFDPNASPFGNHPTFRSNSIFMNPSTDANGRRFSQFAPDFHSAESQMSDQMDDLTPPATAVSHNGVTPPPLSSNGYGSHTSPQSMTPGVNTLPTPPESLAPPSAHHSNPSLSPTLGTKRRTASPTPTPTMRNVSPAPMSMQGSPAPIPNLKYEPPDYVSHSPHHPIKQQPGMPPPRTPAFTIPGPATQQRALPTTVTDWFSPPPPFISPHSFTGAMTTRYWGDGQSPAPFLGLGIGGNESYTIGGRPPGPGDSRGGPNGAYGGMFHGNGASPFGGGGPGSQYSFHPGQMERHGSLSLEQQTELMDVLETEGMSDIDAFLNINMGGMGMGGPPAQAGNGASGAGVRWS